MSDGSAHGDRDYFNFNRPEDAPVYLRAAKGVTPETLANLFKQLEQANEEFAPTPAGQRQGALIALGAVARFLAASGLNGNGRFSRPLELLYTELRKRPLSRGIRILPDDGGGEGGFRSAMSDDFVIAAAAFTLEVLCAKRHSRFTPAARSIAEILDAHGFPFGERRTDKGDAIKAWRRDYLLPLKRAGRTKTPHRISTILREYRASPPFPISGNAQTDRSTALEWLSGLVARARYGAA